jgi:hypothetical protein
MKRLDLLGDRLRRADQEEVVHEPLQAEIVLGHVGSRQERAQSEVLEQGEVDLGPDLAQGAAQHLLAGFLVGVREPDIPGDAPARSAWSVPGGLGRLGVGLPVPDERLARHLLADRAVASPAGLGESRRLRLHARHQDLGMRPLERLEMRTAHAGRKLGHVGGPVPPVDTPRSGLGEDRLDDVETLGEHARVLHACPEELRVRREGTRRDARDVSSTGQVIQPDHPVRQCHRVVVGNEMSEGSEPDASRLLRCRGDHELRGGTRLVAEGVVLGEEDFVEAVPIGP